jgi:hypothetical protein
VRRPGEQETGKITPTDFSFHGNVDCFRIKASRLFWLLMKGNALVTFADGLFVGE